MADSIPITRINVPASRIRAIRSAVREVTHLGDAPDASRLATLDDAPALLAFLSDPAVHAPIYSLPRPLTEASVRAFVQEHLVQRAAGEGLLFVRGEADVILGYSDIQVWPQWAAGELGGALHPSLHHQGRGSRGAAESFAWMFEALLLDVICETASHENVPTQRMLDGLGFTRKGEVESVRPDGTARASLVWEITRSDWLRLHPN
ncbi:GNAT family N-acetyltransferase [Hyphomonas sp.]|uniref:GNAT family N-acetyltransferase n=1 Tax=Hyphomonas sp. TaxID=87 RepID=UPI0032EECBF0